MFLSLINWSAAPANGAGPLIVLASGILLLLIGIDMVLVAAPGRHGLLVSMVCTSSAVSLGSF